MNLHYFYENVPEQENNTSSYLSDLALVIGQTWKQNQTKYTHTSDLLSSGQVS